MRSWYLSRVAVERRLEPHHEPQQNGVYDRRPSVTMLIARLISGLLAFTAVLFSLTSTQHPSPALYTLPPSNLSNPPHLPLIPSFPSSLNPPILISAPDGTQAVVQRPNVPPRGTLLLLHGCSHSATDYFMPTAHCPICLGLPQNRKMAQVALQRHYNVIAVSSTDRTTKCWHTNPTSAQGHDYDRIRTALDEAQRHHAYTPDLPLYAVGGSSGGYFASSLPLAFPVTGVLSIISSSVCVSWGRNATRVKEFPPHVFTHMGSRDRRTGRRVKDARAILHMYGIPSAEFNLAPKAVTTQYLMDAEPRWNASVVEEVVTALRKDGFLDGDGFLVTDPRRSGWRAAVDHLKAALSDTLVADQSMLSSELNRAWAQHETSAEFFEQALEFLERWSGGSAL